MGIQFPEFKTANIPGAVGAGERVKEQKMRNALLGHEVEQADESKRNREQVKAMRQMTANAGEAISQLEADGQHDAAQQLRTTMQSQFKNTIEMLEAGKGWVDADNYKEVRSQLLQGGVVEPEDMPVEFDGSFFDRELAKVKNNLEKISLSGPGAEPGQVMTEDRIYDEYGKLVEKGKPYEDPAGRKARTGADGKPWQMNASDSNAIGRSVGEFLGATWSPVTGTFSGLDRESASRAQTLKEEAARIYRESAGDLSHDEATSEAIRRSGTDVRKLQDERANDPLGIRTPPPGNALAPRR